MTTHTIRRGETLGSIAKKNHTTVSALARANHIQNANRVKAGQHLTIPDGFEGTRTPARRATPTRTRQPAATPTEPATTRTIPSTGGGSTSAVQRRLASVALSNAQEMHRVHPKTGRCALGVHTAIQRAMGLRLSGNGNSTHFPPGRFREVHMSLEQALRTPGLVLTWQHTSTRLGQRYGHIAVTMGDGHTSASDFVESDTVRGSRGRSGLRIFQPIS